MKIKKGIALLISLALVIGTVLPGTLALSADEISSNGTIEVSAETPAPDAAEAPASEETVVLDETPTEESAQTCTCDPAPAEGEAHKEGCPLYVTPEQPAEEEKACTCDPAPAEGEAHKEGCPLYVAPEQPAASSHIETCSDDCTDAECKCPCHLFDRLMACTTLEEMETAFDEASDETINALTDEQNAQIDAKIEALEPAPAPAVVVEESSDETVPSEVVYQTVNYTFVAPFGDPVTGGHR